MKMNGKPPKRPARIVWPELRKPAERNPLQREIEELKDEFASCGGMPSDKEIAKMAEERLERKEEAARIKRLTGR
jgi:chorismate mutase